MDLILREHGPELGTPRSLHVARLIDVLVEEGLLQKIPVEREGRTGQVQTKTRYAAREVSPYAVGVTLLKDAYLSHGSAMFLHALTDQIPKTLYVNREQSPKPRPDAPLSQASINRAFRRPARKSTYMFKSPNVRYVLLSGKHTGRLEVSPMRTHLGEEVDTTRLERTLIDIVVRPDYAGGPAEVLRAYRAGTPRASVGTLLATLQKLDYVYPYHQCIGFLLQRSGAPESQLRRVEALGIRWDFCLTHQMTEPAFDSRWRIHYPQGL